MTTCGSHPRARLSGAAGKAGYGLCCVASAVVLVISGFSYFVVNAVAGIQASHAIISGPSIGAQNILVMGLESRTDWNGNILPNDVLRAMHASDRQAVENGTGDHATNTLILIHIFPRAAAYAPSSGVGTGRLGFRPAPIAQWIERLPPKQ